MLANKRAQAERYLRSLSTAELLELQAMIDEELSQREAEEAQQEERMSERGQQSQQSGESKGKAGGYVELKMINGCGPYAYRRARVAGRLTSEYIGKVKQ